MVMHEQVTDFMDVLFGETSEHISPGEINFVVPRQREFEQELEIGDMSDFIETGDELSLIPNMDDLLGKSLPFEHSRGIPERYS